METLSFADFLKIRLRFALHLDGNLATSFFSLLLSLWFTIVALFSLWLIIFEKKKESQNELSFQSYRHLHIQQHSSHRGGSLRRQRGYKHTAVIV